MVSRAAGCTAQFPEMPSVPCHVPLHRKVSRIMAACFFKAMEALQLHSWLYSPPPPRPPSLPAHLPAPPTPQAGREGWTLF